MARNTTISEEAARKRQEIGLSARRETARAAVMRPPTDEELADRASLRGFGGWWLVIFTSLLALATFLLIAARFLQSKTDISTVDANVAQLTDGRLRLLDVGIPLRIPISQFKAQTQNIMTGSGVPSLSDGFTSAKSLLSEGQDASRSQRIDPIRGVYVMRVESGSAAWSLLGDPALRHYRLETSATIALDHLQSSAGLIVRFIDANHFYLFAIDGERRFQVLQANGAGNWRQLLPWINTNSITPASNILVVEDYGTILRFYVNGALLFEHQVPTEEIAQTGDAGLWSAAIGDDLAEVEFNHIRLDPLNP